jgi:hypothetical protein
MANKAPAQKEKRKKKQTNKQDKKKNKIDPLAVIKQ